MNKPDALDTRLREFNAHVWDHNEDAFQQSFDLRAPLEQDQIAALSNIHELLGQGRTDEELAQVLRRQLLADKGLVFIILQLVGLTREKLKTDVRPVLQSHGVGTPADVSTFASRPSVWDLAGPYLAKRIRGVFTPLLGLDREELSSALESINQATWPGYIRQERAKRSGGEAEQRLAILFRQLDIPHAPEGKADNGLTKDATIAGESFDLVVPNEDQPKFCILAMVHAANIGQYGESKAGDAAKAKEALGGLSYQPLLGVLADGVGFNSNAAGLAGLLTEADEVFQFQTLWKAAVVAAHVTNTRLMLVLPDAAEHSAFLARYASQVTLLPQADNSPGWVPAGEGVLRRA